MALHGWIVVALGLTAAIATSTLALPAFLKLGVCPALTARLTAPTSVDRQLHSLFKFQVTARSDHPFNHLFIPLHLPANLPVPIDSRRTVSSKVSYANGRTRHDALLSGGASTGP